MIILKKVKVLLNQVAKSIQFKWQLSKSDFLSKDCVIQNHFIPTWVSLVVIGFPACLKYFKRLFPNTNL